MLIAAPYYRSGQSGRVRAMSLVVSPYDPLPTINSALLRNPPDAVPPTGDLESLHAELKLLRERTLERAKKAGEDLKIIEESMRRMKEKEKGKAKALEKVKKERGCTCSYNCFRGTLSSFAFILILVNAPPSPLASTYAPSRVFPPRLILVMAIIWPTSHCGYGMLLAALPLARVLSALLPCLRCLVFGAVSSWFVRLP